MKKTLIALALTALPVAAMADVTLYGQIKGGVSVEQTRIKNNDTTVKDQLSGKSTDTVVRDYGSRIGFKGEEDLGNGLKTIWQVEQNVSLGGSTGTKGWSNRETFMGLEGDFGKIRVGHLKNVFDAESTLDQWEYDSATPLGLGIWTRNEDRVAGASIKYDTPNLAGFTGSLQYRTKANGAAAGETMDNDDKTTGRNESFLGLGYENSGFFAKYELGYTSNAYVKNNGNKAGQLHRLEAGYDANNLFVGAGFQYGKGWENVASFYSDRFDSAHTYGNKPWNNGAITSSSFGDNLLEDNVNTLIGQQVSTKAVKTKEIALSAAYTMGAVTPKISYAHGWDMKDAQNDNGTYNNTKYDQVVIGADYALSKRTTALVSAGWLRQGLGRDDTNGDAKATQKAIGVGMKHVF